MEKNELAFDKVEGVTKSEIMGLDTWNQERSTEQLLGFLARRESEIFSTDVA